MSSTHALKNLDIRRTILAFRQQEIPLEGLIVQISSLYQANNFNERISPYIVQPEKYRNFSIPDSIDEMADVGSYPS